MSKLINSSKLIRDKISKKLDKKIIYILFPIIIVIAKIIRYTIMKETLVDRGIGDTFVNNIKNNVFNARTRGESLTAIFFDVINIFSLNTYIQFEIFITVIWNLILFFIIFKFNNKFNLFQTLFIIASIAVLNIFDFCLAKEPLQMLFFIAIYLVICSNKEKMKPILKVFLVCFIFLLIAIILRKYYILMAFFFIMLYTIYFALRKIDIKKYKFLIAIACVILLTLAFLIFSSLFMPSQYKELLRVKMNISNANTDIPGIIELVNNPNEVTLLIDYIITFIRLLFPFELLLLGFKYWPYVFYQLMITYCVIKSIIYLKKNDENKNLALFAYLAFLIGSSMFEPDFGSWIRHEAVFCPILFIICGAKNVNIGNKKER